MQIKSNEENNLLFEHKILKRNLQGEENNQTEQICSRGIPDLIEYYQTGNSEILNLEENITCKEKDKYYMKALIKIVKFLSIGQYIEEEGEGLNINKNKDGTPIKDKNKRALSKNSINYKPI